MLKNVIGLMSGTSMDGVDAAYLKTNGIDIIETGMAITLPYGKSFRNELSKVVSKGVYSKNVESQITNIHADAVKHLIKKNGEGKKQEPIEEITMDLDEEYSSKIIDSMNRRKGKLIDLKDTGKNKKRIAQKYSIIQVFSARFSFRKV